MNHYPTDKTSIGQLVQDALNGFIATKLTPETMYGMQASIINIYRTLYSQGIVADDVNPALVKLCIDSDGTTVGPRNVYTKALMTGDVRLLKNLTQKQVKKISRYDIAKA